MRVISKVLTPKDTNKSIKLETLKSLKSLSDQNSILKSTSKIATGDCDIIKLGLFKKFIHKVEKPKHSQQV